jgi:hypothetical protein
MRLAGNAFTNHLFTYILANALPASIALCFQFKYKNNYGFTPVIIILCRKVVTLLQQNSILFLFS